MIILNTSIWIEHFKNNQNYFSKICKLLDSLDHFPVDNCLYLCYTFIMKTAISIPDTLFEKAEKTARYMGIPRSKLYVIALEEYISKNNGEMITQKLNEIYSKVNKNEFEKDLAVGLESLRNLTKNDTW